MKTLILGLLLSASAMADSISFDRDGKSATIIGTAKSTTSEVMGFIYEAYEYGFKDANGEDFFTKKFIRQGMRSYTAFTNKNVKVSVDSGFAVIYKLELNGKPGDIVVASDRSSVVVQGEAARMLMGALATTVNVDSHGPVGVGRVASESGKVICTKVVSPRAVPKCTLKL